MEIIKRPKFKMTMAILLLLILEGALYIQYTTHTNGKILALNSEIDIKKAQIQELDYYNKDSIKINGQIVKMGDEINRLGVLIPDYDCTTEFTQDFYNMLLSKKYKIDKMNVNFTQDKNKVNVIKLNIETSGSPKDISNIMDYLRNYKRQIAIKGFRVQAGPDNTYIGSINAEMYYIEAN